MLDDKEEVRVTEGFRPWPGLDDLRNQWTPSNIQQTFDAASTLKRFLPPSSQSISKKSQLEKKIEKNIQTLTTEQIFII